MTQRLFSTLGALAIGAAAGYYAAQRAPGFTLEPASDPPQPEQGLRVLVVGRTPDPAEASSSIPEPPAPPPVRSPAQGVSDVAFVPPRGA